MDVTEELEEKMMKKGNLPYLLEDDGQASFVKSPEIWPPFRPLALAVLASRRDFNIDVRPPGPCKKLIN